jgi:lipopolysaccharide/colanic/teichoic acid biosynthesis glycosyltransferase
MSRSALACKYPTDAAVPWSVSDVITIAPGSGAVRCRRTLYFVLKRAFDLPLAALLFVLLAPFMGAVALALRLSSPGPVFFRQKRLGRNGQPFDCLKFRSMRVDAELVLRRNPAIHARYVANGYKLPEGDDPRITPLGRLLRKTSLDELPQLFNVLRGEMSLVGPRPIVPAELSEYGRHANDFLAALPGVTGLWQVSGRSRIGYPQRALMELDYVYGWSLWRDLRILALTVPAVLSRNGAH